MAAAKPLFSYTPYWAECFGTAPFLPVSREEMDQLGWDSCDIIMISGDAYVDHPSFGMAVIGRLWEAQGFRVGIIAQPDWLSADGFRILGKPNLFFAVSAGNMDSMINRYTADRRIRTDDAYTPDNQGGKRPDRAVVVYSQRCRETWPGVQVLIGGIEASLRRIAQYDYWSDKVRRSVLVDSKADLLVYGNAERAVVEIAHRAARGEPLKSMTDIRGSACMLSGLPADWLCRDSRTLDLPGTVQLPINPYAQADQPQSGAASPACKVAPASTTNARDDAVSISIRSAPGQQREFVLLPAYEQVCNDPVLYAHASRVLHLETNPSNARPLAQFHGDRLVWVNPPPLPLTTEEMDGVFDLPYQRVPHPSYRGARIPAYDMIRFSVNIMRGCFGGCAFCSITEHEGRVIQSRSEESIVREIEAIRDRTPGFTGTISDLGGPTANMYGLNCVSEEYHAHCRRLSCVYPTICKNLITDHSPTTRLYRKVRAIPGVKRVLIASGLRYDLAMRDTDYIRELVTHHVGGYLKIAPEHTEAGPLSKMMKPGIDTYDAFKYLFETFSKQAGKEQYLIPYFISAHPGTRDEDMVNLALWLKRNSFRLDQVQNFYPSPMAMATTMYHTGRNPIRAIHAHSEIVETPKGDRQRRLHKAFLRYHDPENWPLLRETLKRMGKAHLIGHGKQHLVPPTQPANYISKKAQPCRQEKPIAAKKGRALTQHTGLPPANQRPSKRKHNQTPIRTR